MKIIIIFSVVLAAALALFGAFRFADFLGRGGTPPENSKESTPKPAPDEFLNGQKFKLFSGAGFEAKYPAWPNIDLKAVSNSENIKIAVADQGCVFMLKVSDIPAGTTFKENTEKLLLGQAEKISKTLVKEIGDDRAHFEGEVDAGTATIMNVSYTYLTGKNQSAGFTFAADKNNFNETCRPIIDDVVKGVNLAPLVPAGE